MVSIGPMHKYCIFGLNHHPITFNKDQMVFLYVPMCGYCILGLSHHPITFNKDQVVFISPHVWVLDHYPITFNQD
jgi:hypothetical protein